MPVPKYGYSVKSDWVRKIISVAVKMTDFLGGRLDVFADVSAIPQSIKVKGEDWPLQKRNFYGRSTAPETNSCVMYEAFYGK
ncbi:MAG: hypothetical protein LBQ97_01090 [Fusobacteriaceae bacterium]|jgi:hypothetical protein|nr:hypothetical protein [Fusobacteriaceae bacterium]